MPRTKGSKNKKAVKSEVMKKPSSRFVDDVKEDPIETEDDEIKEEPIVAKPVVVVAPGCPSCTHGREAHYGGEKGWCNTPNCPCQEFK